MVQLLFDVHHVPSRLLVLPVVTFSELLQVTKFWNPRPGIVWKAERRRKVRYYRNGETRVLLPCSWPAPQTSGASYGLSKATLEVSLQTTLVPQPGSMSWLQPQHSPGLQQPMPQTQPTAAAPRTGPRADSRAPLACACYGNGLFPERHRRAALAHRDSKGGH